MKSEKATWRWQGQRIVPLFLAVLMVSCAPQAIEIHAGTVADNSSQIQQVPTLQSGFEIPAAHYPQPLGTDLYVIPSTGAPGGYDFQRIPGGCIGYTKPVEVIGITVGSGPTFPLVQYRNYIKTNAGEVHCNLVGVCKPDPKNPIQAAFSQCDLRITSKLDKIQFYLIKAGYCGPGPATNCYQSVLVIDIAQDIKPGVYITGILVFVDGKYLTTLHCAIDVNP